VAEDDVEGRPRGALGEASVAALWPLQCKGVAQGSSGALWPCRVDGSAETLLQIDLSNSRLSLLHSHPQLCSRYCRWAAAWTNLLRPGRTGSAPGDTPRGPHLAARLPRPARPLLALEHPLARLCRAEGASRWLL